MRIKILVALFIVTLSIGHAVRADQDVMQRGGATFQLIGPSNPYLSFADSPFSAANGGQFEVFYLEDFEDGALNVPGVDFQGEGLLFAGETVDSVDADDGVIDGSGTGGISLTFPPPDPTADFVFEPIFDGRYPTHVGLVWTDGLPMGITTTFEAFDAAGVSLGTIQTQIADGVNTGTTSDDHFFGVVAEDGISRITLGNSNDDTFRIEVDHLQYGSGLVCLDGADTDADGIPDALDNCRDVANPDQRDTNADGVGNICDTDLNNDGLVNVIDLGILRTAFFAIGDLDADFNGDQVVNVQDLGIMRGQFFEVAGPSCTAGT